MDFRFTPQEEAFRKEVREWLDKNAPPEEDLLGEDGDDAGWERQREMARKFGQRGWLAIGWPKEYGGEGRPLMEQVVFKEETSYRRVPGLDVQGTAMIGPTIMMFGTEEQKREHLRRIARGEVVWCQGYSEPEAGSDLASLKTRAVEDGDDFVINGQKIWTSNAHRADWVYVGVRTDPSAPKHKGISLLIMPVKTPGITVRPIINMANRKGLNETFFDNVRVAKQNLVGEKNRGWYVMAALLDFERSGIAGFAAAQRNLEDLVDYARRPHAGSWPLRDNPSLRHRLAELRLEIEVGRMISYKIAGMQSKGLVPNMEASMAKLFSSELSQRLVNLGMGLLGHYGQLGPSSRHQQLRGWVEQGYMTSVPATIAGGTSEVQRNIIAQRGLGLPRG